MEELFNIEYDLSDAKNYISRYFPGKVEIMGETKQKCFMVTADGPCGPYGIPTLTYCIFPTFMIGYMSQHSFPRSYDIKSHTLNSVGLRSLKLSRLCFYKDDMIEKVLSRFEQFNIHEETKLTKIDVPFNTTQKEIYNVHKLREQLKKDEDDFLIKKQRLDEERQAFEQDSRELKVNQKLFDEVFEEAKQNRKTERQVFETEKRILETERSILKTEKDIIERERQAFEKENQELKSELAKYKGIVENFRKELSPYKF